MNSKQKRVCKTIYKENCYILASFPRRDPSKTFGDFLVESYVSFVYNAGEYAAEWEPEHGPIQIWHKCKKSDEDSKEHYFYDFDNSSPLNWSQLAVSNNELPQAANNGDWDYIFAVLKDWAESRK